MTGSLRTQSARHRVDHGTICGRTCANSGHYKALCAFVDRTFVNPNSSRRRPEKIRRSASGDRTGFKGLNVAFASEWFLSGLAFLFGPGGLERAWRGAM